MPADKLIIFQKIYDFLLWLYPIVNRIPKSHRLVLGKHIEKLGVNLLLHSVKANKNRELERQTIQAQMTDDLDELRILIRLTKDLRFISITQYRYASEKLNEIGKMLYSWALSK